MGRKKKRSSTKSKKVKNTVDIDFIVAIVLVVLGILSFLIIYGNTGVAGRVLSPIFGRNIWMD